MSNWNPEAEDWMERQPTMGEVLRDCRVSRDLTQQQAAEQIGVTQATLSRWETGAMQVHELRVDQVRDWIEGEGSDGDA